MGWGDTEGCDPEVRPERDQMILYHSLERVIHAFAQLKTEKLGPPTLSPSLSKQRTYPHHRSQFLRVPARHDAWSLWVLARTRHFHSLAVLHITSSLVPPCVYRTVPGHCLIAGPRPDVFAQGGDEIHRWHRVNDKVHPVRRRFNHGCVHGQGRSIVYEGQEIVAKSIRFHLSRCLVAIFARFILPWEELQVVVSLPTPVPGLFRFPRKEPYAMAERGRRVITC